MRQEEEFARPSGKHMESLAGTDPLDFLAMMDIDPLVLKNARDQAAQHQVRVSQVLFSNHIISKADYVRQLARYYGLSCACDPVELDGFEVDHLTDFDRIDQEIASEKSGLINLTRNGQVYVAMDALYYDEAIMQLFLQSGRVHPERLLLITPELKQKLLQTSDQEARLAHAVNGLSQRHKGLSACNKTTYSQKIVLSFLFGFLAWGMVLAPISTIYILGGVLNLLFLYSNLLRLAAVTSLEPILDQNNEPEEGLAAIRRSDEELPVYTIMVPLFDEHRVVGQLIDNLLALDYPPDKLDIKLIFEQGDEQTLEAARRRAPPPPGSNM